MAKVTELVAALAAPIAEQNGCTLWDVEYVREAGQWFLRVYIDKPEGISINDCEAVSRPLSDALDEADPIEGSYVLEVSSAGADRPLKKPAQFQQFLGAEVDVRLYRPLDGRKEYTGVLKGYDGGDVTIETAGEARTFVKKDVAQVRLTVHFEGERVRAGGPYRRCRGDLRPPAGEIRSAVMPKKNAKAQKSNELDGAEFFAAINLIEKEKGIPKAYMLEKITQALVSAYKRDHEGAGDNVTVEADEEAGTVRMFVKKDVVEEVDNPCTEMSLQMAREKLPHAQLGDVIRIEVRTRDFGRIAAQTARQVIIQGMREAERGMIYDEFSSKEHEILTGVVTRVDPRSGAVSLRIGSGSEATEAFLAPGEQVKGEAYLEGMRLRVYVVEVRRSTKGPQVLISRTHPGLVKRLFELEVPEIRRHRGGQVHRP